MRPAVFFFGHLGVQRKQVWLCSFLSEAVELGGSSCGICTALCLSGAPLQECVLGLNVSSHSLSSSWSRIPHRCLWEIRAIVPPFAAVASFLHSPFLLLLLIV